MQLGSVVFLLLGPVRRYRFVLAYCSLQLCTSALETVTLRKFGSRSRQYSTAFWTDEIVLDLLLFLILILLAYRAMEGSPARGTMGRLLGAVTVIAIALPFVLFKGAFVKTALVGAREPGAELRRRDREPGTVDGVAGIEKTGCATAYGERGLRRGGDRSRDLLRPTAPAAPGQRPAGGESAVPDLPPGGRRGSLLGIPAVL